jgi:putative transposase
VQTITVRLKLLPDEPTRRAILAYVENFNDACNWISAEAWLAQSSRKFSLQAITYYRARECFGLGADAAIRAIGKVATAYSGRSAMPTFRPLGSIGVSKADYRLRENAVRIAPFGHIPFVVNERHRPLLALPRGEGTLSVSSDGDAYFSLPVQIETPEPTATDLLGVDLGVANIATDSAGNRYSGAALRGIRYRKRRLRAKLQSKGTKSAKRRLKRMRRKESRFGRDVNHCISKQLVATAERTKSALVLEDLSGIRRRVRATRKTQRVELSSWSFYQLRQFITYKAALAGVPVLLVDPRNTSRECAECGHVDKRNRKDQATFQCRLCGHAAHADLNAARVIRSRALLSAPYAGNGFIPHLPASPSGN